MTSSAATLETLTRAFRFNREQDRIFRLLPATDGSPRSSSLKQLQSKLNIQPKSVTSDKTRTGIFSHPHYPVIFAALGLPETGVGKDEIARRTGISPAKIEKSLAAMVDFGWVRWSEADDLYRATSDVLEFETQNHPEFRKYYSEANAAFGKALAHKQPSSEEALFLVSSFSVREESVSLLVRELRKLISNWVVNREESEGGEVVSLNLGFVRHRLLEE